MRKSFLYMVVFTLLLVLGISSCGKPELKKIRGTVKNVRVDDDTLKNLTVMDGEDLSYLISARFVTTME